ETPLHRDVQDLGVEAEAGHGGDGEQVAGYVTPEQLDAALRVGDGDVEHGPHRGGEDGVARPPEERRCLHRVRAPAHDDVGALLDGSGEGGEHLRRVGQIDV